MEQILAKLIEPDNSSIIEGTTELQAALKNPESIGQLCNIIVSNPNIAIRQYAAIVLRKKLCKSENWNKVSAGDKEIIKSGILKALIDEPEKTVKKAICQFVAYLANHELPKNQWPQLIQLLEGLNTSNDLQQRELGMYCLGILLEISGDQFNQNEKKANMCTLFNSTLTSIPDMSEPLAYLTVLAMHQYLLATDDPNLSFNWKKVIETIECLSKKRPDRALECLDMIDDLMNMDELKAQHVNILDVYMLVLMLAENSTDDDLQEKALDVLATVIKSKIKQNFFNKNSGLLERTIDVLLKLMSQQPEDDASEEYFIDKDANTASVYAATVLDDMAIHIAPTKLMNAIQEKVVFCLRNEDPYIRKAGYLALACVTEGASTYIQNNFIKIFVEFVLKGIVDEKVVVQNAALFALGQMSEYLQPEISTFADQVMPILLNFLNHVANNQASIENVKHVERIFYALQCYIDTMELAVIPYLPTIMEALVKILENPNNPLQFKEYAIQTIGSSGTAVGENFMPYFQKVMEHLAKCVNVNDLKGQGDDYSVSRLQNAAVEAIATLARGVGAENFRQYAAQSIELGLHMIKDTMDDPETMKVVFELFASVSTILKHEMIGLPTIMELMLKSIENDDEYVAQLKESNDLNIFVDEEEGEDTQDDTEEDIDFDESRSDDEDEDNVEGYTYDCAKIEEKEEALDAIRELAKVTGPAFQPYVEKSFEIVYKSLHHPHEGVRQNAVSTLVQLCCVHPPNQGLDKSLDIVVPKLREIINTDDSKDVVIAALGGFRDLLTDLGSKAVYSEGHLEAVHNSIKDVLNKKTECQGSYGEDDEEEAEKEEQVIEAAGEVLPALSKAVPAPIFVKVFSEIMENLYTRLNKSMDNDNDNLKSFIVGTIAECIPGLGDQIVPFVPQLLTVLVTFCKDKSSDIKQNSVYGLGVLAMTAKEALVPSYPELLEVIYYVLQHSKSAAVTDNVCAALCRMIIVSSNSVPLDKVIPEILLKHLPLSEDVEETEVVLQCLCGLYNNGEPVLRSHLAIVLKVLIHMLANEKKYLIKEDCKNLTLQLTSKIIKDFPSDSDVAMATAEPQDLHVYETIKQNL